MQADNPLYGEYADEELRVDLFQPPSDDETEGMTLFSPPFHSYSLTLSFFLPFIQVILMREGCSMLPYMKRKMKMMMTQLHLYNELTGHVTHTHSHSCKYNY